MAKSLVGYSPLPREESDTIEHKHNNNLLQEFGWATQFEFLFPHLKNGPSNLFIGLRIVEGKTSTWMYFLKEVRHWPHIKNWYLILQNASGKRAQLCLSLCDPIDCTWPGYSVHGIFQARILEWVAISFSRESSPLREWTCIFFGSCPGRQILYRWCYLGSLFILIDLH